MSYVFISYSHADKTYAHLLATTLEQLGFTAWIDDRIDYGTQWPRMIQEQLDGCAAFIVIMSPRSYASDWVQNELNRAKRKQKPILPLLLEGDEPWLSVESIQYLDVRGSTLPPPRFYERLAQFVSRDTKPASRTSAPSLSAFSVPMLNWCEIPAGTSSGMYINTFRISQYPITNAQFQLFATAEDGYKDPQWWKFSPSARAYNLRHPRPAPSGFSGDPLPRETVSWYEAIAFCGWLGSKTNLAITLPTEQQWLRAAQANTTHEYPWGSRYDDKYCNAGNRIGQTTPVDQYKEGASPFGIVDLAGNVWEWCLTEFDSGDNATESDAPRVVRGGSWLDDLSRGCISLRNAIQPGTRINHIGFRIVSLAVTAAL